MTEEKIDLTNEILEEAGKDFAEDLVAEDVENTSAAAEEDVTSEADGGEEIEAESENGEEKEKSGIKGFFSKKPDKKDEKIEELTDKYQRTLAEFNNFRNRTEKEKAGMFSLGAKSALEKILPVVDNFERGLAQVPEDKKEDNFVTGMDMVYRQLMKTLEEIGVTEIEALGAPFDPELHNAVMHVEDEELGENTVAEVFQKGYRYKDTVLRHSMVKVAN